MVDEHPPAKGGTWVDFNTGQPTREQGQDSRQPAQQANAGSPKGMRDPMQPDGMQAWVAGHHLQPMTGCRVTMQDSLNVFSKAIHAVSLSGMSAFLGSTLTLEDSLNVR